ncbi:glycosyltransferase family 2 protein [Bacillus cereus]|uniref:glycosyltransferase family 2 protein n=1 Tax=Bacillus cereus group TaxID=86661 RepID=UPI00192D7433|nr:glycosyltransferase [Bacillus cereus]MDA2327532.1 glycosyltransferase [Bacillus cereus]MDA2333743.1 glycosyltransferase [Bacillus cereus]MDA2355775.1 glycosyltransferase [Bacillus cereus]
MIEQSEKLSPVFSVIVIAKNEEKNIERCLKSIAGVFSELNYSNEIILVDSKSSDCTIKIASDLEINNLKIIKISESTIYNAALGRNIGSKRAVGKYLLFLDGDMKLYKDFLETGLKELNEKACAGLIGIRDDLILNEKLKTSQVIKNKYNIKTLKVAQHFGGALLIKKDAFDEVGGYRNYINAFEEPELYVRLKSKGYKIYEVPEKMIDHFDKPVGKIGKLKSILFSKRGFGLGQAIQSSIEEGNLKYTYGHKPIAQVLVPITFDFFSVIFMILSLLNAHLVLVCIFFQILSLIVCICFFDFKKFIVSKLLFFPTIIGTIYRTKIEYNIENIK